MVSVRRLGNALVGLTVVPLVGLGLAQPAEAEMDDRTTTDLKTFTFPGCE